MHLDIISFVIVYDDDDTVKRQRDAHIAGGQFFAQKMRNTKSLTMIDPLQQHYGRWMGLMLSLTAASADIFWTAATFTTLGQIGNTMLGVDATGFILSTAVATFTYTGMGGLYSVAYTDILQLAVTFLGMWTCVIFCATSKAAGLVGPPLNQWQGPSRGAGFLQMIDHFIMSVCGGIPWQVYFQRVLASKTVFDAKILSFMTALGCLAVSVPAVVIGGIAKNANFTAAGYDGPYNLRASDRTHVLAMAMQWLCPGMVSVFGLNAMIAAIMSSADSSMLSAATVITRNVYHYVIRPAATDMEITVVLRTMVCLLGTLSALLALSVTSVMDLWMAASDVVFVLIFPQLVSLFYLSKLTNSYGAFAGAVLRGLCGERSLGIPVVLQLPMYDSAGGEQRFPFRTLCMLTNLSTMMITSHVARVCFDRGWLPGWLDVCGCFSGARRQRAASFFETRVSVFSSPEGPTSKRAEPHAEGAATPTSPENVEEHLSSPSSNEAKDHPTMTTEAKDQPSHVIKAKVPPPTQTTTAKGHAMRRKSSVSAKKKRCASKPEVESGTAKRGDGTVAEDGAAETSP
ncbi:hypothetical protein HPB49_024187 [Dermacentor silvarum]|uniref:Uncharacterized protein n=1 Tax=Dermacentor silvarum TaxID=543639 RepID=A0ACB8C5Z7_DERSI|nr:hypothetical protein HPB49_024187 [Dermacentor silvarum]